MVSCLSTLTSLSSSGARVQRHVSDCIPHQFICVSVQAQDGQVEHEYAAGTNAEPAGVGRHAPAVDTCTVLYHHLNHPRNAAVLPPLLQAAHGAGPPALRLLKLLAHALFAPELYGDVEATIARGAFAVVHQRRLSLAPGGGRMPVYVAEKARWPSHPGACAAWAPA